MNKELQAEPKMILSQLPSANLAQNPELAVRLFSTAEAFADGFSQTVSFKPRKRFEEIKDNIMNCFKMGASKVVLFEDKRKNDCLTIRKEDFNNVDILDGFIKIDTKNKIEALQKRKLNAISSIEFYKKKILEIENEILKLQEVLTD